MAKTKRKPLSRPRHHLTTTGELPNCPGTKLGAFRPQNAVIQWFERLDDSKAREGQSGVQGFVFRVKIKSQTYALKVFKFFDPLPEYEFWSALLEESITPELVALHSDPLYAECRAYGRIKEAEKKGLIKRQVAIPCHGFLLLQKHDEQIFVDRGIDLERKTGESNPVRAILKDITLQDSEINSSNLNKVLKDIRQLNKQKIYNRDIRLENFRNRQLVDFGSAWTEPHCILDGLDKEDQEEARDTRLEDLVIFDDMVEGEGFETQIRAMPNLQYLSMLRSWAK